MVEESSADRQSGTLKCSTDLKYDLEMLSDQQHLPILEKTPLYGK